jgi:ATP-binding cassette, subfamily B, multidrug efflux pump
MRLTGKKAGRLKLFTNSGQRCYLHARIAHKAIRAALSGHIMPDTKSCSIFSYFENLIDPFKDSPDITPPNLVTRFYAYYLLQVWPIFVILLLVGLGAALVEVALFQFMATIVDLAQATAAAEFFHVHAGQLLLMAVVALLVRPALCGLHDLLMHQTLTPNLAALVGWQNHRYVLQQSLEFFNNAFAGRITNRVLQTGATLRDSAVQSVDAIWHVVIYLGSALILFA